MFGFCFYLCESHEEKPYCFVFRLGGIYFFTNVSNDVTDAITTWEYPYCEMLGCQ